MITTFADLPEVHITDDEAAAHGDMRLVPMLEVEMNGNTVPLALAPAAATVQVGAGALATTIVLEPASGATTKLTITPSGAKPTVKIGDRVQVGDVVADVAEGVMGARVHASIAGAVVEVSDAVVIDAS